jgi:hypothetical protein
MLERSARGDVVSVTALGMRSEIFAWLDAQGAVRLGPTDVRRLVRRVAASRERTGRDPSPRMTAGRPTRP